MIAKCITLFARHPFSISTVYLVALIAVALWILSAQRKRRNQREQLSWRKHLNAPRFGQDTHY